ncbi:MAG TPA: hypothetical protein VK401_00965 [Propionibacteriaceae bacterium]|nr:hypothetical protein [Propionibacteriaceae bacterium]
MDLPTDLPSHLRGLVEGSGLGDDSAIIDSLTALAVHLRTAVSSYLGLRLTLVLDGWPVTLTAFGDIDGVRPSASLRVALSSMEPGFDPESRIVLYAGSPGAFVDLASDLAYLQRLHGAGNAATDVDGNGRQPAVALDADLPPDSTASGLSGLTEYEVINQAVGVLIGRGHSSDHARAALRRAAATDGLALPDYAARLVEG